MNTYKKNPVTQWLARGALALTTAVVAETASAAGAWNCQLLTESNPLPASINLLRGRQPTESSRDGTTTAFTEEYAKYFTDGNITIGNNYGWRNEFVESGGAFVCYSVTDDSAGVALASVRFTTTHSDKGRSQVRIAKLSVKHAGQDEWTELADSRIVGPEPTEGQTNFQATYADADGKPIADGVTAIRLDFDNEQQGGGVGFGEIEATAFCAPGTWTCRPQTAARSLLPSANILRDLTPTVSSEDGKTSVTYASLRDGGLALGSVRVTSTAKDGSTIQIDSVQVKTSATGETWFTLPNSAVATNAANVAVWEAFYANPEGQVLVSRVTDLKVVFTSASETARPVIEATEAGTANWTVCPLAEANPMPAKENALLGRTATDFSYDGTWSAGIETNRFTDGKIDLAADIYAQRIASGGGYISYRLCEAGDPNGVRLRNVRVTTTHKDAGRSEVRIDSLLVKMRTGGETWYALPNANIVGPDANVRLPNNQATYARADGAFLVSDATDIRIEFSVEQQNGYVGISEIEASCKPYRGLAVIIR